MYFENSEKLVTDRGKDIKVDSPKPRAVEVGLRLAMEKYGKELDVNGSAEYKKTLVDVAVKNKLDVSFKDPELNRLMEKQRAVFEKGENIIAKAEQAQKVEHSKTPTQEQNQPNKGWSR
ncbi:relaxase [Vibrio astriarenae]|nr:relaxase [Vibrio sp. C7]